MATQKPFSFLPTKLKHKLRVCFCLMSLVPLLIALYVISIFFSYSLRLTPAHWWSIAAVLVISAGLALLGYLLTKDMVDPIESVSHKVKNLADGKFGDSFEEKGTAEIEELSSSLRTISQNARELLERVEKMSLKDALTGLHTYTYIRERLSEEIQRAVHYQHPCSFVYIHLEDFDIYEKKFGSEAADGVLKAMARICNKHLSEFDRAARINRNEFAMIFPDKNKKSAIDIVSSILEDVQKSMSTLVDSRLMPMKVFVGISENPLDGVSAEKLYKVAEQRMKIVKASKHQSVEAFASTSGEINVRGEK